MKSVKLKLTGVAPLVMHAANTADPQYKRDSGIRALETKRQKTEADEIEKQRLEFIAGLYWRDSGLFLPGLNFDAALSWAASALRKGGRKLVQSCVQSEDSALIYGGRHATPDELFADKTHVLRVPVVIPATKSRIVTARPIFPTWEATVIVKYHSLSESDILEFATRAGDFVGIGDWRPRHGRFTVETVK